MTKNNTTTNTYVFYNISGLYITFMTNNKTSFITSSGIDSGSSFTTGSTPNGEQYTFYTSEVSPIALLKPIIVKVTGNFGYLSICTLNGYNGGQNLIAYSNT